jgi:predicted lipoprotein with Yx(FWY)xxD motif
VKDVFGMKKIEMVLLLLIFAGAVLLAGCTSPAPSPAPVATTAPPATTAPMIPATTPGAIDTVTVVTNPRYGPILADVDGKTLYYTLLDTPGSLTSACTGDCATTWPPFHTDKIQVSAPLLAPDFGTITRPDGTMQTTYLGWPLYSYSADMATGDAKGYGAGTVWYVMGTGGVVTLVPTTFPHGSAGY